MFDQIHYFLIFLIFFNILLFGLHSIRLKYYRGPFEALIYFLWFASYITGHLGMSIDFPIMENFTFKIRYSSCFYTLIFIGTLLVYITEGAKEARNLIISSLSIQLFILLLQTFVFYFALPIFTNKNISASLIIFTPSYWRFFVSFFASLIDLFLAVSFYQYLVNLKKKMPNFVLLLISLIGAMILDSLIFVGGTRYDTFLDTFVSHVIFKTFIIILFIIPLTFYLRNIELKTNSVLSRGTFDIFSKIEDLESDLQKANDELKEYAQNLEKKVEERTEEISKQQNLLNLELAMASDVQNAMLPNPKIIENLKHSITYLPCSSVSGDLYNFHIVDKDLLQLFIADISGHGVPSALLGVMCNMILTKLDLKTIKPAKILQLISDELIEVESSHYLTGIYLSVYLQKRILVYSNGAHPAALMVTKTGKILKLEATGSLIGVNTFINYEQKLVKYSPDTRLVLFTDCVTEHKNDQGEEFGNSRFEKLLVETRNLNPDEVNMIVVQELKKFNKSGFKDDLTLIIIDLP